MCNNYRLEELEEIEKVTGLWWPAAGRWWAATSLCASFTFRLLFCSTKVSDEACQFPYMICASSITTVVTLRCMAYKLNCTPGISPLPYNSRARGACQEFTKRPYHLYLECTLNFLFLNGHLLEKELIPRRSYSLSPHHLMRVFPSWHRLLMHEEGLNYLERSDPLSYRIATQTIQARFWAVRQHQDLPWIEGL